MALGPQEVKPFDKEEVEALERQIDLWLIDNPAPPGVWQFRVPLDTRWGKSVDATTVEICRRYEAAGWKKADIGCDDMYDDDRGRSWKNFFLVLER